MTILEALKKSGKIKRSYWASYIIFKECGIFTEKNNSYNISAANIMATDWEPVIEKKKLYKALYRVGSSYVISDEYYESTDDVKHFGFIKLLPHTEIEV